MKTALQELLEWIDSEEGRLLDDPWWEIQVKIQELLLKEKEQIETAFEDGVIDSQVEKFGFGEHYYTKTYKTDEK